MRDEVISEWKMHGETLSLHVYCHISGGARASTLVSCHLDIETMNSVTHSRFLTSGYTTKRAYEDNDF
jgi:hypothetical protein